MHKLLTLKKVWKMSLFILCFIRKSSVWCNVRQWRKRAIAFAFNHCSEQLQWLQPSRLLLSPSLTLHELMGSGDVKLSCSEEADQQRVRFVPEAVQHQFGQVVSLWRPLLHHEPQIFQGWPSSFIRLMQLILRLKKIKQYSKCNF